MTSFQRHGGRRTRSQTRNGNIYEALQDDVPSELDDEHAQSTVDRTTLALLVQQRGVSYMLENIEEASIAELQQALDLADSIDRDNHAPVPTAAEVHTHAQHLHQLLQEHEPKLQVAPVPADGSCLLYSVMLQIRGQVCGHDMLTPGYHAGCTGQPECSCFQASNVLRQEIVKYVVQHYASDQTIQTLMIGRLEDSGHSDVAAGDVVRVYERIMLSKHVMMDVLEQYVLAHLFKRDILHYDADSPAQFPCVQYSAQPLYGGIPFRVQYSKLLKHYNALLEPEIMAKTPILANMRLENSGLSINFSNAYSVQLHPPMQQAHTPDVHGRLSGQIMCVHARHNCS